MGADASPGLPWLPQPVKSPTHSGHHPHPPLQGRGPLGGGSGLPPWWPAEREKPQAPATCTRSLPGNTPSPCCCGAPRAPQHPGRTQASTPLQDHVQLTAFEHSAVSLLPCCRKGHIRTLGGGHTRAPPRPQRPRGSITVMWCSLPPYCGLAQLLTETQGGPGHILAQTATQTPAHLGRGQAGSVLPTPRGRSLARSKKKRIFLPSKPGKCG